MNEQIQLLTSDLTRISFAFIGFTVLLLVSLTLYKKHQREILWGVSVVMFITVLATIVFGYLSLFNRQGRLIAILGLSLPCLYIWCAEKLYKASHESAKTIDSSISTLKLPTRLDTPLAEKVFSRALKKGFIVVEGDHYKRKDMSKSLLSYMCGRIYCGDESYYDKAKGKYKWKQGKQSFPETELNKLFDEKNLAQLRYNSAALSIPQGFEAVDQLFVD